MAGDITLNQGVIAIQGTDQYADSARVEIDVRGHSPTDDLVRVTLSNFGAPLVRLFPLMIHNRVNVTAVSYVAGAMNDSMENRSALSMTAWGGSGNDVLLGGTGADTLYGDAGNDYLDGAAADDRLYGAAGNDHLFGDVGNDYLWGQDQDDFLVGGSGTDYLYGGNGSDKLDGAANYDFLYGQADYDFLHDPTGLKSDSGSNTISGTHHPIAWFDLNVQDASVRSVSRRLADDGQLSRADMLTVYDQVESNGSVSTWELNDLRDLAGTTATTIIDSVRFLAGRIANGDRANAWYQETTLGNLTAGASSDHLQKLVNKWFLGLDHPVAKYDYANQVYNAPYQFVSGSIFQNGVSHTDVSQGGTGDCYFLAAMASIAQRTPGVILNMFTDNGDNTYAVRFFKSAGETHFVTVDRMLPTYFGDRLFASFGNHFSLPTNELWVALAEKAYAQLNESGWIGQDGTNSYEGISGGWSGYSMTHITGLSATEHGNLSFNSVVNKLAAGKLLTVSSESNPDSSLVVGNHAYTVLSYNSATQKFTVFNPWGLDRDASSLADKPAYLELTWSQIQASFDDWDYT